MFVTPGIHKMVAKVLRIIADGVDWLYELAYFLPSPDGSLKPADDPTAANPSRGGYVC